MEPRLIRNLTDATQVDGVYIFELDPPGYVRGAGTSIVGMLGEFERGPVNEVISVGSTATFRRIFGSFGKKPPGHTEPWHGYSGFRAIKGKFWPSGLRIVRPLNDDAERASRTFDLFDEEPRLIVRARDVGNYGNRIRVSIMQPSDSSLDKGFSVRVHIDDQAETVENLHVEMDDEELALATERLSLVKLEWDDTDATDTAQLPLVAYLEGGADGTPSQEAWSDAIDALMNRREVNVLFHAQPSSPVTNEALRAHIKAKVAPPAGTEPFVVAVVHGSPGDDIDDAASKAQLLRADRMIYAWPHRYQHFSEAVEEDGGKILMPSSDVLASAIANLDPIFDPASPDGGRFINASTVGLEFDSLDRDNYVTANRQGIAALEFDPDLGFRVVSGITTDLRPDREMIHVRRTKDYLITSFARALKNYQNMPITEAWKDDVVGAVEEFLQVQTTGPVPRVLEYEVDHESVNDSSTEAQGIFKVLAKVRIPASARFIILLSEIGTSVNVTAQEDVA